MAELAASTGSYLVSQVATSTAQVRGVRVTLASTGLVSVAASTVRGEFVSSGAVAASGVGAYFPLQPGGIIPMLAAQGVAFAVGDTVYSAASGEVGSTSSSTVIIGKANTAVTSSASVSVLFEVIVENPL